MFRPLPSVAQADRVLVSVNPKAGARPRANCVGQLIELLTRQGLTVRSVSDLDEAAELAVGWHGEGTLRAVVAAGGDGTAAELANRTPPGVPLALLPLGTENLLAKYLGVHRSVDEAAAAILGGRCWQIDAGQAGQRLFLLMVSCGFDADVVARLHGRRRGNIRHLSYIQPIFESLRRYNYPELTIRVAHGGSERGSLSAGTPDAVPDAPPDAAPDTLSDATQVTMSGDESSATTDELKARWAFVFNLPCYARGIPLAPAARGDDGRLDLCAFHRGSHWHALRYLAHVWLGRHSRLGDCTARQVERLRIESDRPVPYQLDGDHGGYLPVTLSVVPRRVTLVVPESFAPRHAAAADEPSA